MTTLAPSNEMDPPASESSRFFAHIADSGGWSTQFILFSGTAGQAASGTLSFIDTAGQPWDLTTDSGVSGSVPPSGGAYADLVLASASVSSATPMAGQPFELRANVDNRGTGASTATTLRFYRSTDTTISSIDTEVGTDAVSALAAGGTSSSVLMLTALSTAGTYYYGACVDPVSGESNSQNNCSSAVRVTVSASQMEIDSFDLDPDSRYPRGITFANDRFYVVDDHYPNSKVFVYRATGQRDSASDFDLDSENGNPQGITFANDRFYVVDGHPGRKVYVYHASGQRDSASDFDLDSENGNPEGITFANDRFYVVGELRGGSDNKVYAYQADGERDSASDFNLDSDNRQRSGITFANDRFYVIDDADRKVYVIDKSTHQLPDLVLTSTSVSDNTPTSGESFVFRATVRNRGTLASAATTLRYYRSDDRAISTADMEVGSDAVGALAPSETSSQMISLTTPSTAGTYYYGACVDSVSGESNTGNNCSSPVQVTVRPDLRVRSSVSETTLTSGDSFVLTATVRNGGNIASAATTLHFYRSDDRAISTADMEVGTDAVSALAPSETSSKMISLTAPSTSGTYYYGACVDYVSGESNSRNNCSLAVQVTVRAILPT